MPTLYAKGLTVNVVDGSPAPVSVSGTGKATLYAKGLTVDVQTVTGTKPIVNVVPLNTANLVLFWDQHDSSRYDRYTRHKCLTTDAVSLRFQRIDLSAAGGGAMRAFAYPKYGLLVDGVQIGTCTPKIGANNATFTGTLTTQADGPVMLSIVAYDATGALVTAPTECFVPFWVWIDRKGEAKNHPDVIFQNGSFDWTHWPELPYMWARVPKTQLKTRIVPQKWWYVPTVDSAVNNTPGVPAHVFPGGEPFNTALPKAQITRINFVPCADDTDCQIHRPTTTSRGITVTEGLQGYFNSDVLSPHPRQPLLDGPRGQGTVYSPTSLWPGHSGNVYGMDSFSFWKVRQDGSKVTFAGLRHPTPLYWEEMWTADQSKIPGVEIVGNWDASIPVAKRFPWESWGMQFDTRRLGHDLTTYAPLPPFPDLPVHLGIGPVAYSSCRFGRILQYQFDKTAPNDPPKVTEWVTSVNDPWGMAIDGNIIYVAERGANRISMWSADTPNTLIGVLLDNPNGASFGSVPATGIRKWVPAAGGVPNYTITRQQPILAPEGLAVQDGYCYWGSLAQGEVRRINLTSKVVEVVCRPPMFYSVQSLWLNLKLSDGSFGPRGTVFTTTFDNQYFGRPRAWVPTAGKDADGTPMTNSVSWDWHNWGTAPAGPGGLTDANVYACALGINNGMLAIGTSGPGLSVFVKATLGEAKTDLTASQRGWVYYRTKGYSLVYGNRGMGYIDAPLPWGENPDCDYWLTLCGHTKA